MATLKFVKPHMVSSSEVNIIRGKNIVGKAGMQDVALLFAYIDALETKLDELDCEDYFGTEGWRHSFNHPDAD